MSRAGSVALAALAISLVACVPWTVRPIESVEKQSAASSPIIADPAAYVDSIWDSRILPAVAKGAVDARELLDALKAAPAEARQRYGKSQGAGPVYFIVKGEGRITSVDTRSRAGLALVDVAPFDQRPDVSIQIGPVLRGTSLRDATGVVRFSDFVNQLQFADAGIALNERVRKTVLASLDPKQLKGRAVKFSGTLAAAEKPEIALPELLPVTLTAEAAH